jgi:uncharacterized membrane protein YfcA
VIEQVGPWGLYLALFAAGLVAGTLNVIAGGGSFLTLPLLLFAGLPAAVANGTNRVGILLQNVGAVWGFHRHRVLDWRWALAVALPALLGAGLGTALALVVGEAAFRRILASLMVVITLWTLLGRNPEPGSEPRSPSHPVLLLGFFFVGLYGGFVQAGVGFLILACTSFAGLDLVRGNAVKVLTVLAFTALSLGIFAWQGKIEWALGLSLAAGTVIGGQIGVRLTVLKGHAWVRAVVAATVVIFAIRLWLV